MRHEETDPGFVHLGREALPVVDSPGLRVRVIMGRLYGVEAPTPFPHDTFYAEAVMAPGAVLPLDADYDERAIYIVSGEIDVAGDVFGPGRLLVFRPGDRISVLAVSQARLMLLGGEPMDGPRHIWWNFVSSRKERIDQPRPSGRPAASRPFRATRPISFRCRIKMNRDKVALRRKAGLPRTALMR